tara:strand:+ start:1149 stop:1790 length:642 start_codon:yes stop_codon:yes gene_type:complete
MIKPNYYSIIPANVRYDKEITPNAKLLYAELTSLCNMNGKCTASSRYFANLYEVSRVSIQKWLKILEDKKYIKREIIYKKGSKEIDKRYITLVNKVNIDINTTTSKKKLTNNNNTKVYTNNNITYNNIHLKKIKFEETVFQVTDISKDILQDFVDYWTETNKSCTKMKFEMQKTFDINLRLKRWIKNNKNWNNNGTSKIDNQLNEYLKGKELL